MGVFRYIEAQGALWYCFGGEGFAILVYRSMVRIYAYLEVYILHLSSPVCPYPSLHRTPRFFHAVCTPNLEITTAVFLKQGTLQNSRRPNWEKKRG